MIGIRTERTCHIAILLSLVLCLGAACSSTPDRPDEVEDLTESSVEPETDTQEEAETVEKVLHVEEIPEIDEDPSPEKASNVAPHVNARVQSAIKLAADGNSEAAIQTLTQLVNESEGGFLAAYNLGVIHDRRIETDLAARRYMQALQKNPDFTPALVNLVRLYLRQNQTADADQLVRRFMDLRPDNLDHRAVRLEVLLAQGRYEDLTRQAKEILRRDERHVNAMIYMAQANLKLERNELAKAILGSALKLSPNRAELYYLYGLAELAMDSAPRAILNFRKAVELQPDFPEARNNLGVLYHDARDHLAAVDQFEAAVQVNPQFKEAYLNLGNAHKGAAQLKEAETAFRKALAIDKQYTDAYFNLGILYLEGDVPGMETIPRLTAAIEAFNNYRSAARGQLPRDDPAGRYIEEANVAIENARKVEEMTRRAQAAPAAEEDDDDDDDEGEESEDDGTDNDDAPEED